MFERHTIDTPYPVGPVHLYVFKRRGGLILFDTGPPTKESFEYLQKNIDLNRLKYVLATHSHADHSGGIRFLAQNSNADIFMPKKDILKDRMFDSIAPHFEDVFIGLGFPKETVSYMFSVLLRFRKDSPVPENVKAVEESVLPQGVEFIPFPGHSISDFVYIVDKRYAISGDFLLNGIFQTPLIEIDPQTMKPFNNYEAYCNSISNIDKISNLIILPSHLYVDSVIETVAFYVEKILKRSEFVLECLKQSCSVFDAVSKLTDPYSDPFKAYLKASEIVFFKSFVENPELLKKSLEKIGLYKRFERLLNRFI